MEGELYNIIQKPKGNTHDTAGEGSHFPRVSFIPADLVKKEITTLSGIRDKCALGGLILGMLSLFSWVVILFGVFFSVLGLIASLVGLKSNYFKYARVGLLLSSIGLIASLWYFFAVYHGMVNYNYFTTEFWFTSTSTQK